MAPRQNIFGAIRRARSTPVNAQERTRTWIFGNYCEEYHMPSKVRRTVMLTRAEFDQLYMEPALERWALQPSSEPEATSDSSKSGGVPLPATELGVQRSAPGEWKQQDWAMSVSGFGTSFASSSSGSSTSNGESDVSSGLRSPRQPRSLPELLSEQPELGEAGSGYEADSSDNEDSSQMSSTTGSDSSLAQYTPDASSSNSDSEPRYTSSRVTAVAWREHHERLAELDRAIDHAHHSLRTTVSHSFGEYMTSVADLEALEHEREQLRSGVRYPRHQLIAGIALLGANTFACSPGCIIFQSRS